MNRPRSLALALAVASITIAADRVTKIWAENNLVAGPCRQGGDECIDVLLSLRLHLVYNHGAAFSTGTGFGPVFAVLAAVMSVVLFAMAARSGDRTRSILFGLIAGGAIGNLIDRVVRADDGPFSGGVIDFIDLQWWPIFNVADMAVVTGVLGFVVYSLLHPEEGAVPAEEEAAGAEDGSGRDPGGDTDRPPSERHGDEVAAKGPPAEWSG